MLQGLKKMGLKTGIVGNIWSGWIDPVLVKGGIDHLLDVKVASVDVGFRKPDPRIFRLTLDRLGVNPREAMMVGDDPNTDISGTHEFGMVTVRLLRGPRRMQPDKVQPDMKTRDFKALWSVLGQDG